MTTGQARNLSQMAQEMIRNQNKLKALAALRAQLRTVEIANTESRARADTDKSNPQSKLLLGPPPPAPHTIKCGIYFREVDADYTPGMYRIY